MIAKIHHNHMNQTLVAVCDDELLGKKFEEEDRQIDLTGDFYKGKKLSDEEIGDLLRNADSVNIVGEKSIELGIKEEVVDKDRVLKIAGIPIAIGLVIRED